MKYGDDFLRQLKTAERIPDVLTEFLPDFKRTGANGSYTASVPWRQDEHPSLGVYRHPDGVWAFSDRAQGDSGDVITLVERVLGHGFPDAVTWLADRLGMVMPEETSTTSHDQIASVEDRLKGLKWLYDTANPLEDGTVAAEYLRDRGLLAAARAAMGQIDLHPASTPEANSVEGTREISVIQAVLLFFSIFFVPAGVGWCGLVYSYQNFSREVRLKKWNTQRQPVCLSHGRWLATIKEAHLAD